MLSSLKGNFSIPFNPADWYALAVWFYDTKPALSSQCLRRTIIGRAYYAALICARDATHSNTTGQGGHDRVVAALRTKDNSAAGKLDSLRLKRQSADYHPEIEISVRDVEISLLDSKVVLTALGMAPIIVAPHNKPYSQNYLDKDKFLS
jgi:hypothetical protein